MGRVGREEKHVAFADDDVAESRGGGGVVFYYFEEHGAAVLEEVFGGFVDVVVGSGVGTTDYLLNCEYRFCS